MTYTVAIIGRPNVGKSTLFNRLVGRKLALVDDTPGVTRDRRRGAVETARAGFEVIDTAGLEGAVDSSLPGRMEAQTRAAMDEADLILFLIDARAGVTPLDEHYADLIRRHPVASRLVVNKCEGRAGEAGTLESYSLGLGEPLAISAEHGVGIGELLDEIDAARPDEAGDAPVDDSDRPLRLAVIGRPNAGKSTLINTLLGETRLLAGPEAGLTRDSIGIDWRWRGNDIRLFDTAGIRRRARVDKKLEKLAVADALRAIRFAEVVILLLDGLAPLERQERLLAAHVEEEGRALVLAVNKWDLVSAPDKTLRRLAGGIEKSLHQLRGIRAVPVSALTGAGTDRLLSAALKTFEVWNRRIDTAPLNRWLGEVVEQNPPPAVGGRRIRIRYITQSKARPPTFIVFCSRADALPESYRRYLVNALRQAFGFPGTPIKLLLRKGKNPYARG